MEFKLLAKSEEELLKELLDHRDRDYWYERFKKVESSFDEDAILRGNFKELINAGMITVCWADGYNFETNITHKGLTYFANKKEYQKDKLVDSVKAGVRDIAVDVVSEVISKSIK